MLPQVGVLSFRHECLLQVVGLHLDLCRVIRRIRSFADPLIFYHPPDLGFAVFPVPLAPVLALPVSLDIFSLT